MEASRFQYKFDTPQSLSSSGMLPHESLPLSLLALVNRGRIHPSLDEILLRTERAHNLSIRGMLSDPSLRNRFAVPSLCIEDSRLVIHMCKSLFLKGAAGKSNFFLSLKGILPRAEYSFRVPDEDNHIHHCLSKRIYRQFPQDSRRPRERPAALCDDWDTSGGEDNGDMSDEDMSELEVSFNLVTISRYIPKSAQSTHT